MVFSFNLDRIWAETTNTMVSWVSELTAEDVRKVAEYFRNVRYDQYGRGMNVTWDGEKNYETVNSSRLLELASTLPEPSVIQEIPKISNIPHRDRHTVPAPTTTVTFAPTPDMGNEL